MSVLTIAGLYLLSALASTSEGALVQTDISDQLAAANGNLTTLKTQIAHGIAAGPAYRGTFDIAWSCLLTILACIYNAIHLNVPPHNTGKWMLLLRKVKWATIALFAPEIVLYTATTQFLDACKVKKEVNALRGQIRGKNKPKLIDLRYCFYVTMGGFAYDVGNLQDGFPLVTLTPRGIITLARQGQFVDISTEDITDKSKADIFTKSLVCVQVSWMVIQCIARKAAGYPLTLLEIHTMVHVICALTIYMLWWRKPYDIIEPTIIYAADYASYKATVALMLMGSNITYRLETFYLYFDIQARLDNNLDKLAVNGQETSIADKSKRRIRVLGKADSIVVHDSKRQVSIGRGSTVCTLHPGQYLPCGIGVRTESSRGLHPRYDLTWSDIRRWELGALAIVEILKSPGHYDLANTENIDHLRSFLEEHGFDKGFDEHTPDFREGMTITLLELAVRSEVLKSTGIFFLYLLPVFIPLTTAYGGIHLSAWNFEFPTRVESMIWRTACFIIIGGFFLMLALPSLLSIISTLSSGRRAWWILAQIVIYGFILLLFLCYAAARLYLVVESFISLRHVPIGVYAAVPWVQNIPHV